MHVFQNFLDGVVKFLEGHSHPLAELRQRFLRAKVKLTTVLIIVGSVAVVVICTILFGSAAIAGAKFDADRQVYLSQIADLKNKNTDYKDQYQQVLQLKNDFRSSIKDIVEMLYNKDSHLAIGGPSTAVPATDEAVLLQIRTAVNTMKDDQGMLGEVKDYLTARKEFIDNFPFVWPTVRTGSGRITSGFGFREDPFDTKKLNYHPGLDIGGNKDDPVYATADGVVEDVSANDVYGNYVVLKHKYGFETIYGHLDAALVHVGQQVKRSDLIGKMGDTGEATGYHLHYEIRRDGGAIDPMLFLNVTY